MDEDIIHYLPPDLVNETPSIADGITLDDETSLRVYGCELIQEAGILLKLYVHGFQSSLTNRSQPASYYGYCSNYISQVLLQEVFQKAKCQGTFAILRSARPA